MSEKQQESSGFIFASKCTILAIFIVIVLWRQANRKKKFPAGPTGLPLVGYLPFLSKEPLQTITKISEAYGAIFTISLGPDPCIFLNSYEVIYETMIKNSVAFAGRPKCRMNQFSPDLGIIFRNYGNVYKDLRKFIITTLNGFGVGKQSLEQRVNEEVRYLSESITSKHGQPFNIQNFLSNAVANVITSVVKGERSNYDDEQFKKLLAFMELRFSRKNVADRISLMEYFPSLRHLPGFKQAYELFCDSLIFGRDMMNAIIEDHAQSFDVNSLRDFVDAYLKESMKSGKEHFTMDVLNVILRDLFNAGTETTTTTLRWCFLYLAKDQKLQDDLRAEVEEVCGTSSISMRNRGKMPLICSFIHEIQRHRPIIPFILRKTTENVSFRGYSIPRNTPVIANVWKVHHDPETFDKPYEFHPKRFIDKTGKFSKHDQVIPFGLGSRYCIGIHLAEMELFIFLAGLLQNFEIEEDETCPLPSYDEGVLGLTYSPLEYKICFRVIS